MVPMGNRMPGAQAKNAGPSRPKCDHCASFIPGRSEVWEDREHAGVPTAHFVLGRDGAVQKIEVLRAADSTAVRVFEYAGGHLVSEAQDTNGDGVLDRFERFDADGEVVMREEDLNGDGKIDVRSFFEKGKLVRREIIDPELLQGDAAHERGAPAH